MNRQFNKTYLEERIRDLNDVLKDSIEIFILGGGAMSFYGLKDATRDIDVVLKSKKEYRLLVNGLHKLEYEDVLSTTLPYLDMNTSAILENRDKFRWDIFVNIICNGLLLSNGMIDRAEKWISHNKINTYAVSPEDSFIFKSITSRERDRDDMNALFIHGLNFDLIKTEMLWQTENSNDRAWLAFFYLGLEELRDKYDVVIPYFDDFYELACNELLEYRIKSLLQQRSLTIEELVKEIQESESWARSRINVLIEEKIIKIENGLLKMI